MRTEQTPALETAMGVVLASFGLDMKELVLLLLRRLELSPDEAAELLRTATGEDPNGGASEVGALTPRYLSVTQAVAYTHLSRTSLFRAERDGHLRAIRCGRRLMFDINDLDSFMRRNRKKRTRRA